MVDKKLVEWNKTFGDAVAALKENKVVARIGWNGKDMYLFLVKNENNNKTGSAHSDAVLQDYIAMKTADGYAVPWLASQTDVLAEDWIIGDNTTHVGLSQIAASD